MARYRTIFPWRPYETLEPGSDFTIFDTPGVACIGLVICYDGSFPEVARQLAWLGGYVISQLILSTTRDSVLVDPEETIMQQAGAEEETLFGGP